MKRLHYKIARFFGGLSKSDTYLATQSQERGRPNKPHKIDGICAKLTTSLAIYAAGHLSNSVKAELRDAPSLFRKFLEKSC